MPLFVLFEHSVGFGLFKVAEFEDAAALIQHVRDCILDFDAFCNVVALVSFQPFASGREAWECTNSSVEGSLHANLQLFLENNLPKSKKKRPVTLGVEMTKLATVISEILGISCSATREIIEVIRGIRSYFHKLVKGIKDVETTFRGQISLGHNCARAKLKFNVNRIDNMVIQSICLIDQLDKDINSFSMRVREWYSLHFPELIQAIPENYEYVKCVIAIKNRKQMPEDIKEQLENILMDSEKAQNLLELARTSMGIELCPVDMENVVSFANRVNSLMTRRQELMDYLKTKMHNVAPNLAALIGETVGARLIAHAGSLVNLAKFPASTVQILGAEKALFRAIKTHSNTPKYGLIYHSTFIGRADKTNKGRISRYLANKCSVATRIDCFRDIPTEVFGSKMRGQVEDRLKFLETGEIPPKNLDVMVTAVDEADVAAVAIAKAKRKAEKRAKKRLSQELGNISQNSVDESIVESNEIEQNMVNSEKKKKRKKERESLENNEVEDSHPKKKRKIEEGTVEFVTSPQKNKKVPENVEMNMNSPAEEKIEEETEEITDPEVLKRIKKAKKKERKRLKALQASMNGSEVDSSALTVDSSMVTDNASFLTNNTTLTNDSYNSSMNVSESLTEQDHLDNSIVKKKKKKKKKKVQEAFEA